MNYEYLKAKMDKFLKETSADELVAKFEAIGYTFVDVSHPYQVNALIENNAGYIIGCADPLKYKKRWYSKILRQQNNIKNNDLETFRGFFYPILRHEYTRCSI